MTQDGTWTYSYDAENRLTSVTKSGQTLNFVYDYLGRRIRKTVTGTGAVDLKFLWNGWTLAADLQSDGSTIVRSYIWGPDQSGGGGHPGALLGTYNASGSLSYAMADALGNIVGYLNASGAVAAAVEYSPVGKGLNVYLSGVTLADYPIGFSGEYMDWETGTVYYGLRYYAPKHGRFINRDPIEEAGGNNLYGFVGNNPVNAWDNLGMVGIDLQKTKAQDSSGGGEIVALPRFEVHESRTDWQSYAGVTDIQDDALRDNDLQGRSGGIAAATAGPPKAPTKTNDPCPDLRKKLNTTDNALTNVQKAINDTTKQALGSAAAASNPVFGSQSNPVFQTVRATSIANTTLGAVNIFAGSQTLSNIGVVGPYIGLLGAGANYGAALGNFKQGNYAAGSIQVAQGMAGAVVSISRCEPHKPTKAR